MPGYNYTHDPALAREAFFADVPGIFYPNTYANAHKTPISRAQVFTGRFEGESNAVGTLFSELLRHGYRVNAFTEVARDSCQKLPSSSCHDRRWAIETGMFKQDRWGRLRFGMERLLHAYL